MKYLVEIVALGSTGLSGLFWILSACVRLTKVGAGVDQLDLVTTLSADLQTMARWNAWAAAMSFVSALSQIALKVF